MHLSISSAAVYLGVSISTLRRWHQSGDLVPDYLTVGRHRRYSMTSLKIFTQDLSSSAEKNEARLSVIYGRVSSSDQKRDLDRQISRLESLCKKENFNNIEVIRDLGSGLKYDKKGLKKLLKLILSGQVSRLVLHHKDRLLRFGSELVFRICEYMGTEVIIIEENSEDTFEDTLAKDVLEIITVFSAKLYGRRSHINRRKAA